MKTTIVIPNYNGIDFLKNCLESATKSTVCASIIVVDNGSSDQSLAWLSQNRPDVKVIAFPTNQGFCAAVNAGICAADTPYVFLLNNDTTIEPDCIKRLEDAMEEEADIFSVGAKMLSMREPLLVDGAGDLYCACGFARAIGKGKPQSRYVRRRDVFSNCAGAALYKKELFDKIGLFDETHFAYLEDVDVGYRARIFGYRNVIEPAAVVYHVGSGSTGSRHNAFKVTYSSRNNVYLAYKNMPFFQLLLNLPLLLAGFLVKFLFFCTKGLGKTYAAGLWQGIKLCMSQKGRAHKVPFRCKNLGHYAKIQWELWRNLLPPSQFD